MTKQTKLKVAIPKKKSKPIDAKRVTRYTYNDVMEPRQPETGHTQLLPADEQVVSLPMDNGWGKAIEVGRLPESDVPVVVDMDPATDPVLFWAGKRSKREIPVLPLQRNEIISESRIAQIIGRARQAAIEKIGTAQMQLPFADLEKQLRESDKSKRVEFYTHDEKWKNKLICGDSLDVMESMIHYEGMRGSVQMIFVDPPYGIGYNSNFQQRVDTPENDENDRTDDVLTIKAFRDTWALGIHSYLSYLQDRFYLCRELLKNSGSIFVQISDENTHRVRAILDEVFGAANFVSQINFVRGGSQTARLLASTSDYLLWYAKDRTNVKYRQLYVQDGGWAARSQDMWQERPDGTRERISSTATAATGAIVFTHRKLESATGSEGSRFKVEFDGHTFLPTRGWSTSPEGIERLKSQKRLLRIGNSLRFIVRLTDFPYSTLNNYWNDTYLSGFATQRLYAVQTADRVLERCMSMTTDPGDVVLDPTSGSGTTAYCAEKLGRRWIACDTSRVAINIARQRLLSAVFEHFKTVNGQLASGFIYRRVERVSLKNIANDTEPEKVELVDQPQRDVDAIRVTGPFEVMSLGRYSVEDWKGYVKESGKLENYIEVICRLYDREAAVQGASGLIHAIVESEKHKYGISVGPLTGRVSGKQINDAVQDALASGILEIHVLGWAFEANVGEVKSQLESRGKFKIQLIMIRPDTLAEGLKATQPEMLFSPLALPDVEVGTSRDNDGAKQTTVTLSGVGVFDRKKRTTDYFRADSGYIAAWYLDEDYDGDCFVDCQMFFDFKKIPNIRFAMKAEIEPSEYKLQLTSHAFQIRDYKRIAVKVVDIYGNESTVVKNVE